MIDSQRKISGEGFRYDADGQMACYIIHGFTGSTYEMQELGKYMASQGITAVADILPGHGTSPKDCNTKIYQDWIDSYASEEFEESVNHVIKTTDQAAADSSKTTIKMMHYVFRRATQLEWMFWDSAYQMQSWPV